MQYTDQKLHKIFTRTDGKCHICRKHLVLDGYGNIKLKGAWEVEHSIPRSKGGTDHLNNLYASCVSCNRSKGNSSTASARKNNGFKCAPLSKKAKTGNTLKGAATGACIAFFVPPHIRVITAVCGIVYGAIIGHSHEPD